MSAVTPFIKPIQQQGGTFYAFSSAIDDLNNYSINNTGRKFSFSKYALLNIPDIGRPTGQALNQENLIQFDAIPGGFPYVVNSKSANELLAESFQNYALNLEEMIRNFSKYDTTKKLTISERVFFKWLKELGALRFREATTNESTLTSGLRFTEEDLSDRYNSVVKYIGDLDIVNSVKSEIEAYSEIYVHVPTKDGATPLVLFKSTNDENYFPTDSLKNVPKDPLNTGYIVGRKYNQIHPVGLDFHAYFDSLFNGYSESGYIVGTPENLSHYPSSGYDLYQWNTSTNQYEIGWWFKSAQESTYWTQPAAITGSFDDPTNDSFKIKGIKDDNSQSAVSLTRSRLDGIQISFDTNDYLPITSNAALKSFSDFNSISGANGFLFNAVLVYYDVYESNNQADKATNLFGVLFLDDVTQTTLNGNSSIPRLFKSKPDFITGTNGNAFGFKINLKLDASTETPAIVSSINEYAPFSLQIFTEVLNKLQNGTDILLLQTDAMNQFASRLNAVENSLATGTSYDILKAQIDDIIKSISDNTALFTNTSDIIKLIDNNYQEILNIYNNKTSISVSYDLSVIKSGEGIFVDKGTKNQLKISNILQEYTISNKPVLNIGTDFVSSISNWNYTKTLDNFNNYIKIDNSGPLVFNKPIIINIDDSINNWKTGQSLKLTIDKNSSMDLYSQGQYYLQINTDALDKLNTGIIYGKSIGVITSTDFVKYNGTPKIEIICLDASTYTFTFDLY